MNPSLRKVWVEDSLIESWFREDVSLTDITTYALRLGGEGVAEVVTRDPIRVACSEEAGRIYELAGARAKVLRHSGEDVAAGQTILVARGDAVALHKAWRLAQVIIALCSGVATKALRMVTAARRANPKVCIAVTRKAPPGLRRLYVKAAMAGGAVPHRSGLSDSILVFDNHIAFIPGGWREFLTMIPRLKAEYPFRKVGVEVRDAGQAIEAARAGAEMIQLERMSPKEVSQVIGELRRIKPDIVVAVAGGVYEHNVGEYAAAGPDIIVTTAPYKAPPADVTTRMFRAWRSRI